MFFSEGDGSGGNVVQRFCCNSLQDIYYAISLFMVLLEVFFGFSSAKAVQGVLGVIQK